MKSFHGRYPSVLMQVPNASTTFFRLGFQHCSNRWSADHKAKAIEKHLRLQAEGLLAFATLARVVPAGCVVYQAGCAGVVMACYSIAGATWGAILGAAAPATILPCSSAYGACQAAFAAVLLTPTP